MSMCAHMLEHHWEQYRHIFIHLKVYGDISLYTLRCMGICRYCSQWVHWYVTCLKNTRVCNHICELSIKTSLVLINMCRGDGNPNPPPDGHIPMRRSSDDVRWYIGAHKDYRCAPPDTVFITCLPYCMHSRQAFAIVCILYRHSLLYAFYTGFPYCTAHIRSDSTHVPGFPHTTWIQHWHVS